jgi:hypothetical protein
MAARNKKYIHERVKNRLKLENICHNLTKNLLSWQLSTTNLKTGIHKL